MPKMVNAWNRKTGEKVRIPANWVGHKVFGKDFALTPKEKKSTKVAKETEPAEMTAAQPTNLEVNDA